MTTFSYKVTNTDQTTGVTLDKFELPELNVGDFNLGSFTGPTGWTAKLETASTQSGTGFYTPTMPGAYILIAANPGQGLSEGSQGVFSLATLLPGSVSARFGVTTDQYNATAEGYTVYSQGSVDPPVPGGAVAPVGVPEPASILILGGAVLAAGAVRSRRKE